MEGQDRHGSSLINSAKMENIRELVIGEKRDGREGCSPAVIIEGQGRSTISPNLARVLFWMMIWPTLATLKPPTNNQAEALQITRFRVPAFVPANLAADEQQQLAKPILFDCDYDYRPDEDERLIVKWFKDKEAEPFYQWLPELNVRHFADWIRPLLNQSFVSDPHEPLKRYRSLLIRRLSFNLTGSYTCLVSSLAGQDSRQASVVVYQPPRHFAFEHRIFPAPAALLAAPVGWPSGAPPQQPAASQGGAEQAMRPPAPPAPSSLGAQRPTQFKGLAAAQQQQQQQQTSGWPAAAIVRPANNQQQAGPASSTSAPQATTKIVYTHDGRPIRRRQRAVAADGAPIAQWQLRNKLGAHHAAQPSIRQKHVLQLHQFQCHASQLTPRPVVMLTVKRDAESIAQYLHESSVINVRPHRVGERALLASASSAARGQPADELAVTLYDITVSATVALNVSLPADQAELGGPAHEGALEEPGEGANEPAPVHTVLHFRRGQRMSFECHLEITGTEFERRERIFINEQEVYQFAEAEEERRRARLEHQLDPFGNQRVRASPHQPRAQAGEQAAGHEAGLLATLGLAGSSAAAASRSQKLAPAGAAWMVALTSAWLARRLCAP